MLPRKKILGFSPLPKEIRLVRVFINIYVCTPVLPNNCKIHWSFSTELALEVSKMKSFMATDT